MTFGIYTNNNAINHRINFKSKDENTVAAPISSIQTTIEQGIDNFATKLNEKKDKKSTKTAIAVGSSVVLLAGLITILNPRYSPKIMEKLKALQLEASNQIKNNKNNYIKNKIYKGYKVAMDSIAKGFNVMCNFNSGKDVAFQYMCCETNKNIHLKNKTAENFVKKTDKFFVKIFKKPHEWITQAFDYISKATVKGKYKQVNKNIIKLEEAINQAKANLSPSDKIQVEAKLAEIKKIKSYLSEKEVSERLVNQDKVMQNLERDFLRKWRSYKKGFTNKFVEKQEHVKNGLNFWAENVLAPQKNKIMQQGQETVNKLISTDSNSKGLYNQILEIIEKSQGGENCALIKRRLRQVKSKLKNANTSECFEYFDKKRDLTLGSAPTDIVSALTGLGLCGLAVGTAKDKDERISRLVTTGIPVVVGLGTSLVCTAMLFSAASGLLIGGVTGLGANYIGNLIDKHVLGNSDEIEENKNKDENLKDSKEVENA